MKLSFLIIALLLPLCIAYSQNIRMPRDTIGFTWKADEMNKLMNFLDSVSTDVPEVPGNLIAAISPHDDYLYAGKIYYPIYKHIKAKEIVIFGVTHGTVRRELNDPKDVIILDDFRYWAGPYGNIEVSPLREKIRQEFGDPSILISNEAHSIEHSIEALLPFLQYYNKGFKITPIMVTTSLFENLKTISDKVAAIIEDYMLKNNLKAGEDIFFIISNDANHYGEDFNNSPYGLDEKAHQLATDNDRRIINSYINNLVTDVALYSLTGEIWESSNTEKPIPLWCGRYPIVFGLLTVNKIAQELTGKNITGKLFNYSDTVSEGVLPVKNTSMGTTAPNNYKHWCGFFSAGFYIE